jgi:hypothetical protein
MADYEPREISPSVEHIHLPPPAPKYNGVEFAPLNKPWFEDPKLLDPMPDLLEIQWP